MMSTVIHSVSAFSSSNVSISLFAMIVSLDSAIVSLEEDVFVSGTNGLSAIDRLKIICLIFSSGTSSFSSIVSVLF